MSGLRIFRVIPIFIIDIVFYGNVLAQSAEIFNPNTIAESSSVDGLYLGQYINHSGESIGWMIYLDTKHHVGSLYETEASFEPLRDVVMISSRRITFRTRDTLSRNYM